MNRNDTVVMIRCGANPMQVGTLVEPLIIWTIEYEAGANRLVSLPAWLVQFAKCRAVVAEIHLIKAE